MLFEHTWVKVALGPTSTRLPQGSSAQPRDIISFVLDDVVRNDIAGLGGAS
jgi:hypothetical protein